MRSVTVSIHIHSNPEFSKICEKPRTMECKKERNSKSCNCSYPCSRKGMCCDCIAYHRRMGELPACYFPDDAEKTYDRTVDHFMALYKGRGGWWN